MGETHRDAARALKQRLSRDGFRVEVDERDETLGQRIREAEVEKVPFVIVYGDRESDDSLARGRGGEQSTSRWTSCSRSSKARRASEGLMETHAPRPRSGRLAGIRRAHDQAASIPPSASRSG